MSDKVTKTSIRCNITGQTVAVRPDIFDKRVEKFGGVDQLLSRYVSRDAKRLLREGKSVSQIRSELNVTATDLPSEDDLADVVTEIVAKKPAASVAKKAHIGSTVDEILAEPAADTATETAETIDPEVAEFLSDSTDA